MFTLPRTIPAATIAFLLATATSFAQNAPPPNAAPPAGASAVPKPMATPVPKPKQKSKKCKQKPNGCPKKNKAAKPATAPMPQGSPPPA